MSALIRQVWACLNAGDFARFLALMTDPEAARSLPPDLILETAAGEAPPVASPTEEQTAVYAILDVERLPDGRVGAYVIVDTPFDPLPVEINYSDCRGDGRRLAPRRVHLFLGRGSPLLAAEDVADHLEPGMRP